MTRPPAAPAGGRVGVWTPALDGMSATRVQEFAGEVEAQGWVSLWFGEAYGREAFAQAGLALAGTSTLTVGTGIASIHARDAMAAAAASRTLEELHPGRFVLGLGVSHAPLVERVRGGTYARPLEQMRTYLEAMDRAPYLAAGPPPPPKVLAALGPKMLELARTHATGAHPYLVTPEHTAQARTLLGPDRLLVVEQAVVASDDDEVWRRRAHTHLEVYTGLPNYRNSWTRLGFGDEDYLRGGSERLKQALVAKRSSVAARVAEHVDAGADQVVLQVLGDSPLDDPLDGLTLLADQLLD